MPVDDRPPPDWAQACLRILDAGADGADRVFATMVGAARRLSGADGRARRGTRRRAHGRGERARPHHRPVPGGGAPGRLRAGGHPAARAPVVVFEDLGAVQFLLEPAHGEDLDRYADQLLGPLLAYDRDHDADLVETLRTYLRCDGQVGRAAEELGIHPKTMSYRLGRIETIAGMVLTRQEHRFNAQLALKILTIRGSGTLPG